MFAKMCFSDIYRVHAITLLIIISTPLPLIMEYMKAPIESEELLQFAVLIVAGR